MKRTRKTRTYQNSSEIVDYCIEDNDFTTPYIGKIQKMLIAQPDHWFGNGFCYSFAIALHRAMPGSKLMIRYSQERGERKIVEHFFVMCSPDHSFDVDGQIDALAYYEWMDYWSSVAEATPAFMNRNFPYYRRKEFLKALYVAVRAAKHHIKHNKQRYTTPKEALEWQKQQAAVAKENYRLIHSPSDQQELCDTAMSNWLSHNKTTMDKHGFIWTWDV